jgi:hypothetical protein
LGHAKYGVFGVIREYTKSMFATTAVAVAAVRFMWAKKMILAVGMLVVCVATVTPSILATI